ncbi:MAG: GAF domain-containing protein, partial [Thermodesulfobacteriota bacterium]
FSSVVKSIHKIVDSIDHVSIFTIEDNKAKLAASIGFTMELENKLGEIENKKGLIWKTINENRTIVCDDISQEKSFSDQEKALNIKSYISTTIKYSGRALGSIIFSSNEKYLYSKENIRLLETVALQLEIAIKYHFQGEKLIESQLELEKKYKQLKKLSDHEAVIHYVAQNVHKSIDIKEVMDNSVNALCRYMNAAENVSIFMVEGDNAVLKSFHGKPDWKAIGLDIIPYPIGITWNTIIDGRSRFINDTELNNEIGNKGKLSGIKSIISVPLRSHQKTLGVIHIVSSEKDAFTMDDLSLLEIIARQIENAIINASQADDLKRSEEMLTDHVEQLSKKNRYESIINAITQSVHQSIQLKEVLDNAVLAMIDNIENINHMGIYFVEGDEAVLQAYKGYPDWFIERVARISKPKGLTWRTIIDETSRYVDDVSKDKDIGNAGREVGTKSYASMPIKLKDKTIGAINISSRQINAFDKDEIKLLELVSKQIGTAINNATHAELLKKSNDELEIRVNERTKSLLEANKMLMLEINERKKIENEIKNSLTEKEVLLMEIHHRVKNNLQIITSLLNLQSKKIKDENSLKMFNESKSRIKSMSILHEQLYRSKVMNRIDFNKYLVDLTNHISRSYGPLYNKINLNINANGAMLDINKAIPCGLIVNELVANAYEHGFKNNFLNGCITIDFNENNNRCYLTVKNNGSKLPDDFSIEKTESLGLQLVYSLTKQIKGNLKINNINGVEFNIEFNA